MTPLILASLLALVPLPQEPPDPQPSPHEALRRMQQGAGEDEMVQLFAEVEKRLRAVDRMLYDASAGRPLEGAEESGLDRLLERSREASKQVVEGIDRILEIARERAQQQQGGGGQQQGGDEGQSGDSPLDQQRQGAPGERERTPEGQSPQQEGEPPQDPPQDGQVPEGPQDTNDDPRNRRGDTPPGGETGRVQPGDGNDRWGDLPVHVRELFRVQGGDDLPPRYRDWIDSYYRRLNERP